MGLTDEQKNKRTEVTRDIQTFDARGDKDYVFISYKSDDWENVLGKVVKHMVDEYGLRVYFDKNFDRDNDSWVDNMTKAVRTGKCRAILAFVSKKYMVSYACMLELLVARGKSAYIKHDRNKLDIIPIIVDESGTIEGAGSKSGEKVDIREWQDYLKILEDAQKCPLMSNMEMLKDHLEELEEQGQDLSEEDVSSVIETILKEKTHERNFFTENKSQVSLSSFYGNLRDTIANCSEDVFDPEIKKVSKKADKVNVDKPQMDKSKAQAAVVGVEKTAHTSRLEYWQGFCDYTENNEPNPALRMSKTADRNWHAIHLDKSMFSIECSVNTQNDSLRTAFIVYDRPEIFAKAEQARESIDSAIEEFGSITWDGAVRSAKIYIITSRSGMTTDEQYAWFWRTAKAMYNAIRPCLDV
ncbi:MAG: DUF4268 domain-containing protein [Clostridium sp.]|nr:DUF4268 domain-containing protein [Clostridium sp.]